MSSAILPSVSSAKRSKHFEFASCVERGGRFVKDEQLRVTQIGPRQSHLLPLPTGKIDAAFEAPAEHLVVAVVESCDHSLAMLFSAAYSISLADVLNFNAANGDVLRAPSSRSA